MFEKKLSSLVDLGQCGFAKIRLYADIRMPGFFKRAGMEKMRSKWISCFTFVAMGMFKYTTGNLKKLEALMEELGYIVRYEKGNFQSGYCLVQNKKIAVVNKFYDAEGRINCLVEIITNLEIETAALSEKSQKLYRVISGLGGEEEEEEI